MRPRCSGIYVMQRIVRAAGWLVLAAMVTAMHSSVRLSESGGAAAADRPIRHLLVGQDAIPGGLMLYGFSISASKPNAPSPEETWRATWFGPPDPHTGLAGKQMIASVTLCQDEIGAERVLNRTLAMTQAVLPEVSGTEEFVSFSDRAWQQGGRLLFARRTVVVSISVHNTGAERGHLLSMGREIGRRIDRLAGGRPDAIPAMLLALDGELKLTLEDGWALKAIMDKRVGTRTQLVLPDHRGLPRCIPAEKVKGSYVVPLQHIRFFVDPDSDLRASGDTATATVNGKQCQVVAGKATMTVDGAVVTLPHAVEFADGKYPLVPLDFVTAVGFKPVFGKHGSLTKVTLTPIQPSKK